MKCAHAWADSRRLPHDAKIALLLEYLVLLFHTVMPRALLFTQTSAPPHRAHAPTHSSLSAPPVSAADRVGIIRKLRWGHTLKRDAPGAYKLDLTQARFKNSRFFGPSVTSVSALIAPVLDQWISLVSCEIEESPYLFSKDPARCQTSSMWSSYCKVMLMRPSPHMLSFSMHVLTVSPFHVQSIFGKWSGVFCPPKMLRASFVTWIRNHTDSPEILKSAARAMRHTKQTADR